MASPDSTHGPASRPLRRQSLDEDLKQFAADLDLGAFSALSNGIGIGELRHPDPHRKNAAKAGAVGRGAVALPVRFETATRDAFVAAELPSLADSREETSGVSSAKAVRKQWRRTAEARSLVEDTEAATSSWQSAASGGAGALGLPHASMHGEAMLPEALQPHREHNAAQITDCIGSVPQESSHAALAKSARPVRRLGRRLLAFGLDFSLVTLSLAVVAGLACILFVMQTGAPWSRFTDWLAMPPVAWLTRFSPLELLFGTYAAFFAYWLVFRLVAGKTLGESWLMHRHESA